MVAVIGCVCVAENLARTNCAGVRTNGTMGARRETWKALHAEGRHGVNKVGVDECPREKILAAVAAVAQV